MRLDLGKRLTLHDMPQRSPEWYLIRAGRLTGSVAADMFKTVLKSGGEPAARRDLRMKLATERLTGISQESDFENAEMIWGREREGEAIGRYEAMTGNVIQKIGFVADTELLTGCSPDAYVGNFDAIVSIKCPKSATHLGYLQKGGIPDDYLPQMLHELWVTGAQEYHFMSFDPRFPRHLQTSLVIVSRDDDAITSYEEKALRFLEEVERDVNVLLKLEKKP